MKNVEQIIKNAFEDRENVNKDTHGEIREAVELTLNNLDRGSIRVCQKIDGEWIVNQWIKKAILLSFRLSDNEIIKSSHATWFDKVEKNRSDYLYEKYGHIIKSRDDPVLKTGVIDLNVHEVHPSKLDYGESKNKSIKWPAQPQWFRKGSDIINIYIALIF